MMKCFFHRADFDGKCSAAIVKLQYPDCGLVGIDYGDPFPWDSIQQNEEVWMVDFTIQPYEDMLRLQQICSLVWIDHHKTALEWADKACFSHAGICRLEYAGCELTWFYIHGGDAWNPEQLPLAVKLLGRYDVWDHADPRVLPFQFGIRLSDPKPDDGAWWDSLFEDRYLSGSRDSMVSDIIETGQTIQQYQEQAHAVTCNMAAFDLEWEGLRWTAINGPYRGSMVHKSRFDHAKYDAMLGFYWTGKQWMFSLTTDKPEIDVSEIAKKYGGGGHKGAAGFQQATIPFSLSGE